MSVFSNAGKNIMLDAFASAADTIRMHTGDPGAAGTANAGTATPQTPAFAAASGGTLNFSEVVEFNDGEASEAATWFSAWGDTNTTFLGKGQITSGDTAFNAAGEFRLTTATEFRLDDPV